MALPLDPTLPECGALAAPWSRVLEVAARAIGVSEPNPRVGCVIVDPAGEPIGEGHTQAIGGPHAEVMALRDAERRGRSVRGSTAWVSLEPCAHHGRTPPCCDALIAAGVAQVQVATVDPFPAVAGEGLRRLGAAGVEVRLCTDPAVQAAALALNIGFFSRLVRARPWVRMKVAVSLDGRTALPDGRSQWITGAEARHDGHAWRRRAGAVLTGVGTVRSDDPRLDVRGWPTAVPPVRVVVDSRLETPPAARLLAPPGRIWIAHAPAADPPTAARAAALQAAGAELLPVPAPAGKTDLTALLALLVQRQVNELHLEAGEKLNGSFLRAGLVDELLVYQAPRLIGEGAALAALGPPLAALDQALAFERIEALAVGADLRLRLRAPGSIQPLRQAIGLDGAAGMNAAASPASSASSAFSAFSAFSDP